MDYEQMAMMQLELLVPYDDSYKENTEEKPEGDSDTESKHEPWSSTEQHVTEIEMLSWFSSF